MNTSSSKHSRVSNNVSKTPFEISEYIEANFEGGFHSEIKAIKEPSGQYSFLVNIIQDGITYPLKFDANGKIMQNEVASEFDSDADDDFDFE